MKRRSISIGEAIKGMEHRETIRIETEISGISYDSRSVEKGDLFFAIPGLMADGAQFIPEAIDKGCAAVVSRRAQDNPAGVPMIITEDVRGALALVSANYFRHPSRELVLVGITGTNGKTSTSFIIRHILEDAGIPTAVIGTIGYDYGSIMQKGILTTPEAPEINRMLRDAIDRGISHAVMEVSSHSLSLQRVEYLDFDIALFTNITHDHLDYHTDFNAYRKAKGRLFESLKESAVAVLNGDDQAAKHMASLTQAKIVKYSKTDSTSDYFVNRWEAADDGIRINITSPGGEFSIEAPLVGSFNVDNVVAAVATCSLMGVDAEQILSSLRKAKQVPGRMERVESGTEFTIIVDYAHTPDALKNAIHAARSLMEDGGRLITIFGCGGDRDKDKRPKMGRIASELSDIVIVTSDNPRNEDPSSIIEQIITGIPAGNPSEQIVQREEAIHRAIDIAQKRDVVLICGKGHEDYQEIKGKRRDFSDREVVLEYTGSSGSTV